MSVGVAFSILMGSVVLAALLPYIAVKYKTREHQTECNKA